jgi:hypothetical protein
MTIENLDEMSKKNPPKEGNESYSSIGEAIAALIGRLVIAAIGLPVMGILILIFGVLGSGFEKNVLLFGIYGYLFWAVYWASKPLRNIRKTKK